MLGKLYYYNWGRIHWLSPFIWYCIFFMSLLVISRNAKVGTKFKRLIVFFFITSQILINLLYNPEFGHYLNKFATIPGFQDENITYKQFFSENLFLKIKDAIGLPQEDYRVASIGIHPSISQYNGFYSLDSYQNKYPLVYKIQFRNIITEELYKDQKWRDYFDYWGSRCYIFSSEIPDNLTTKDKGRIIHHLDIDTKVFWDMGGRYILSAAEIVNYKEENLYFRGAFEDNDSVWKIFLYEVMQ